MVVLQHMTPNCRTVEGATRFVSVPEGETGTVAYDVVCEPPPLLLFEKPGPSGNTADIAVIRSNGTDERLLTTHPAWDGDPAWSPDGTRIARRIAMAIARSG